MGFMDETFLQIGGIYIIMIKRLILVSICIIAVLVNNVISQEQQVDPFDQAIKNLQSTDPYIRRAAAEQLGSLRNPKAIPYLKTLLKDENVFVRQTAVESLGLLRCVECIDDILDVIRRDKEIQVKQSAVVALGYIGVSDEKVVTTLIDALQKEVPAVKYAICNTFSILRSTLTIPVLTELLLSEDPNLQRSAIYALGRISHPDSISALRNIIDKNLNNETILIDVIRILTELVDTQAIEKFKFLYSTSTVTEKVKIYSAFALAKLAKDNSVLPTVKKMLQSKDENIKNSAIDAIRFIGDKESLTLLKQMIKTETSPYTKQMLEIAIKQLEAKFPTGQSQQPLKQKTK